MIEFLSSLSLYLSIRKFLEYIDHDLKLVYKKMETIEDIDDAFFQLMQCVWAETIIQSLNSINVDFNPQDAKNICEKVVEYLTKNHSANELDLENFMECKFIINCWNEIRNLILDKYPEINAGKLFAFVMQNLELNYYQYLNPDYSAFAKYQKYISSKQEKIQNTNF